MATEGEKSDWTKIDRAIQRGEIRNLPLGGLDSGSASAGSSSPRGTPPANPSGLIAQFKANQVQRSHVLKHIKAWYDASLDITQHQLAEVVRVRRAEASLVGEQLLAQLSAQHLEFMANLGLSNLDKRQQLLLKLGDQTTAALKNIESRDWPAQIIDDQLRTIMDWYKGFAEKLSQELGEPR